MEVPPNNPLPGAPTGAEPLKKSTGKVQPKKETVRINLPPKPTAAPLVPSIKTLDKVLIFSTAVASLAAVGIVVWVFMTLKNTVENVPT